MNMKKYILFAVAITSQLITSQNVDPVKKNKITLTIKTDSEKENSASIRYYDNLWGVQETFPKNNQNIIDITKEISHTELLTTTIQSIGYSFNFYLEKGDNLSISIKNQKATIEGDSREAKQNRFLQSQTPIRTELLRYYNELSLYEKKVKKGESAKKPAPIDVNVLYQKLDNMVNEFKSSNKNISQSFVQFIEMDTKYFRIKNELQMPNYAVKTYHSFNPQDIVKLEECLKDSNTENAILSMYYRQVLSAYIDYLRINDPKKLLGDGKDWMVNEVKIANYIPNSTTRQFIVADNLYALRYENGKNPQYIETVSKYAGQWAPFIIKEAQEIKGKSGRKQYDNAAEYPLLTGIDTKGNKVSLEDFKGQWVYIDLWATWCGPCKFEVPYLEELKHRLKDYNIVFIGISIDKNEDRGKLLDMIKKENLGGIQLQNSNVDEVYSQLAVMGIPHFAIIDPNGKLYLNKAPKPSTGIPDRLLKSLVNKK
ncbi:thiol-disulfide isomerase/thioredoxin [Flavobacterium granuli]|uniref:Thiol-disulfide isomerase or thioredoxin n=2 Tax=Flavobacterium granuli TaxID=280093 RepID=A0A1M5S8J1_9FLAO|nr:thiol-disulfide isomerase/thioredoxin [Flavobacterium granuli]SHH34816.1 Thiol-disulfide isomerase or thioredoxin [Flavobacterium granuli]